MDISIIIPTIRPDTVRRTVERIKSTTSGVDYEIIISSPLDLDINEATVIKEDAKITKHQAINNCANAATGKYLFHIPDYVFPDTDCILNLVKYMKTHDDELIVVSPRWHTLWEVIRECWIWKDVYFAKTPCIKKDNLSRIGGEFYTTDFVSYGSDIDLSLRVLKNNGKAEICPNTYLEVYTPREQDDTVSNDKIFWEDNDKFIVKYGTAPHLVPEEQMKLPSNSYNLEVNDKFVLPYEKCSRIFIALKNNKLDLLQEELDYAPYIVSKYYLMSLMGFILLFCRKHILFEKLVKYIAKQMRIFGCLWSLQEKTEFLNRFEIRPQNEVSKKDIERLFGIYAEKFYYLVSTEKIKVVTHLDFIAEQMSIVRPSEDLIYEQIKRKFNVE